MSGKQERVRMVTANPDGTFNQIETRPLSPAEASRIAAEAVRRGIPAAIHPA